MAKKKLCLALCLSAFSMVMVPAVQAFDLTQSATTVSEDFNTMWNGSEGTLDLPAGWKVEANKIGPRRVGDWNSASTVVMYQGGPNLPTNAKNGTWNFGPENSDRAIGGFTTTVADGTRGVNLITKLTNSDPNQIITNLTLDYNIEKYRKCANDAGFTVSIFTSPDGVNWTNAGDQYATQFPKEADTAEGAAVVPINVTEKKGQTLRVHVVPGSDIYVAWNISVSTGSSPDKAPGLAIDDIKINAVFADSDPDWVDPEVPEINHSGIYLRGVDGVWDPTDEWEFNKLSDTQFELRNKIISGTFKVADASWSSSCNYGSNGSNIMMGEPYKLASGVDTNISCGANAYNCARILLTIVDGEATLLLEPNEDSTGLTTVYMIGDFNDWNYMGTQGALNLDTSDNLFKGQVNLKAGNSGLSNWLIYQRLGMAGAWGLEQNATAASTSGTLIKGKKGTVASEPATYEVSFNLATGEYSLTKLTASVSEIKLNPSETILVPNLPEEVKVLSLNNSLIHYNDQARMFNEIAEAEGKKASWTKHTNLGKTLDYHWNEGDGMTDAGLPGAKMVIRSDAWSHIILQEQTALPRTDLETFRASVKKWVNYIRENCPNPNAVIILPMNWHYAQDWSNFKEFNDIMVKNYTDVATELGVVVCPVAVAYGNKFDKDGGPTTEAEWFLPGDDRHPTIRSTYMAALMEYGLIFNEDPAKVSYFPQYTTDYDSKKIDATIAAEMRDYASKALAQYENTVNHHESAIKFDLKLFDDFGMETKAENAVWSVEPSTASITDGKFTAIEEGDYIVSVSAAGLSTTAKVTVTSPVEEYEALPVIEFGADSADYEQDFNAIGSDAEAVLPEGWRIDRTDSPRAVGTFRNALDHTTYAGGANLASNAKNGVYNFGASDNEDDRAVGGITTGVDGGTRAVNVYTHLSNGSIRKIESLDISYNIEKYRDGANGAGYTVKLYSSADGVNWKEAGEDFVNVFAKSAATQGAAIVPIETQSTAGNLPVSLVGGAELYLAWNISVTSGNDCSGAPALALDDVKINAKYAEIPEYAYYIYIENATNYDSVGLYAWGDSELFGAWPGQNPFNKVVKDDVTYDVFGHNAETGSYQLIYNNNNQGSQLADYAISGGQDYYFKATNSGLQLVSDPSSVSNISDGDSNMNFFITRDSISCKNASSIEIYSISGNVVLKIDSNLGSIDSLPAGFYIAVAKNNSKTVSKTFCK